MDWFMLRRSAGTLALIGTVGIGGCSARTPEVTADGSNVAQRHEAISAAQGARPVVAMVTQLQGVALPDGQQWLSAVNVGVDKDVPDNYAPGLDSDVTISDDHPSCDGLLEMSMHLDIDHDRESDLLVSVTRFNADGTPAKTVTVFDGPAAFNEGQTGVKLQEDMSLDELLGTGDCSHFRVNVKDLAQGTLGHLNSWTLQRRVAWSTITQSLDHYQRMLFGDDFPNVSSYFAEVSRYQFSLQNVGLHGPLSVPWDPSSDGNDFNRAQNAIWALEADDFDFGAYDTNGNGAVENSELFIVNFENYKFSKGGANRPVKGCVQLKFSALRVCSAVAMMPLEPDFPTLSHEISHSLGTRDLYGSDSQSEQLTLMGATLGNPADFPKSLYLDPMHRELLGWLGASTLPNFSGSNELGDESWFDIWGARSHPFRITKPGDDSEFYEFEFRNPRSYDNWLAAPGVIAWHAMLDGNDFYKTTAKSWGDWSYAVTPSPTIPWSPSDGRFRLSWQDGTQLPYSFWVSDVPGSANSEYINCEAAPIQVPTIHITAPDPTARTQVYGLGHPIAFSADVTDGAGGTSQLSVQWSSDVDSLLGTGTTINYAFGTPGIRHITATVHDQYGGTSSDSITFTATDPGPTATIIAPTAGQTFVQGQYITFIGNGSTPALLSVPCDATVPGGNELTWRVDGDPSWIQYGCTFVDQFSFTGNSTLRLTVRDHGRSASTSVKIRVVSPTKGQKPIPTIVGPNGVMLMDTTYHFSAQIAAFNGASIVSTRWTVGVGMTEYDIASNTKDIDWLPNTLIHNRQTVEVRLYVTDSHGLTGSTSDQLLVERP